MRTRRLFRIVDWTGTDRSRYYGLFKHFDDAWSALYDEFLGPDGESHDGSLDDFYVEVVTVAANEVKMKWFYFENEDGTLNKTRDGYDKNGRPVKGKTWRLGYRYLPQRPEQHTTGW